MQVFTKRSSMKCYYFGHINGVPYKMLCFIEMQFTAYFYTVVPYLALFRLSIYKNSTVSKSGSFFFVILQDTRFRFPNYIVLDDFVLLIVGGRLFVDARRKAILMSKCFSYRHSVFWFFVCFLAHLSRRLTGELIVYPCSGVRPSSSVRRPPVVRRPQFQRSSPLKPLGQSKPNFMWSILRKGERKFI